MKRILLNFLVFLGTCLVVGLVGELACRLWARPPMMTVVEDFSRVPTGPSGSMQVRRMPDQVFQYTKQGGVRLTPNAQILVRGHHTSGRDISIATNSLGFRADEVPAAKGDERRILAIGDSVMMADQVEAQETLTHHLETALRPAWPTIRVINAGMGSADIRNEVAVLKESGLHTQPDVILVGVYLNDGELSANFILTPLPGVLRHSFFAGFLNRRLQMAWYRWQHRQELAGSDRAWVAAFTAGRRLAAGDWQHERAAFDYLVVRHVRDWGAAWDPATWQTIEAGLREMQVLATQAGAQLVPLLFPVRYQVEAAYPYDEPQQYFHAMAERLGLKPLDLLPFLREQWQQAPTRALFYDQCHYTPAGYEALGPYVADFLRDTLPAAAVARQGAL